MTWINGLAAGDHKVAAPPQHSSQVQNLCKAVVAQGNAMQALIVAH